MPATAHLEIILSAGVTSAVVVATIATFVAALTFLIFREKPLPETAVRVVPKAAAACEEHADAATAIAG